MARRPGTADRAFARLASAWILHVEPLALVRKFPRLPRECRRPREAPRRSPRRAASPGDPEHDWHLSLAVHRLVARPQALRALPGGAMTSPFRAFGARQPASAPSNQGTPREEAVPGFECPTPSVRQMHRTS